MMKNRSGAPKGRVIFLLGAGASMDAVFPNVAGLTHELRDRLPHVRDRNGETCAEFPELFDAIAQHDPKRGGTTNAFSSISN